MTPQVTIVTRTNNRPRGFKRLRESIEAQTYENIKHVVLYDSPRSYKYIRKYDCEAVFIDPEWALDQPVSPDPQTGKYFPYNLYFNKPEFDEGYIWYIDDDDEIATPDTVADLVRVSTPETLTIGRMGFGDRLVPNDYNFGNDVRLFDIGGSCIFFHTNLLEFAQWDCWKCSDYRVAKRLHDNASNTVWYDAEIMRCNIVGGNGNKQDI